MKSTRVFFVTLAAILGGFPAASGTRAGKKEPALLVPRDFKVSAQYGSGESDWKAWKTTLRGNGRAWQRTYDAKAHRGTLSPSQLESLLRAVRESRFFDLKETYPTEANDGPTLILEVTTEHRFKAVSVSLSSPRSRSPEIRRFLTVWRRVLELVPSPNAAETPAFYAPK